ncbi:phenylalanine--tRNA ligase beta subunit-related protein [Micromonospora sp. CPCC 205711]|uniref:B3/B4 domain-containing protein n=1 Tax=Micromonospora sp. CPCC 205547 TaxID=3122400 RepID=UPI002FF341FF
MRFQHSPAVRSAHPELLAGLLAAEGLTDHPAVDDRIAHFATIARNRLAAGTESGFPEIQAWRRAFAAMGLPPTRYRCAAESLLRRYRREGSLPRLHPLVDLCNAVSLAFAVPVGVFDRDRIDGDLVVRHARGDEEYLTFAGDTERPDPGEVIFADDAGRAHARRWTNRQSGWSAVRDGTRDVLIVVEAMHARAGEDVPALLAVLVAELAEGWRADARSAVLTDAAAGYEVADRPALDGRPGQALSPGARYR